VRSSNTNNKTVHKDSTAVPPRTNQVATLWTAAEYFGDSSSIPAPTENAATMLIDKNQTWGQRGDASPAQTALKYVSIAAILAWCVVALMAIAGLVRSLVAFWRAGKNLKWQPQLRLFLLAPID
jgi:hypothetical protein